MDIILTPALNTPIQVQYLYLDASMHTYKETYSIAKWLPVGDNFDYCVIEII